ncbi:hypothetical protein CRUP_014031, partial [Coryphaenoides rupestris]
AKQQYEQEEKKKELKRLRGEDTWMLPELNQRLQQIEQEDSVKTKKKKKEKKSKKAKKEKKKKAKKEKRVGTGDDSSDSSQDSEEEWVEATPQVETVKAWKIPAEAKPAESSPNPAQDAQRDEWMTFDFLAMKTTSTTERRAEKDRLKGEEKAKAQAIEQAGLHKLELNPFWKDGGSGLPPEKNTTAAADVKRVSASIEEFQKRLADAEEAAYGAPRRGGDRATMGRGGWGTGQRDGWRRREADEEGDRGSRGRHDRERDGSPPPRDGGGRGQQRDQGRERERGPGEGRDYPERDRSRDGDGERDRDGERARRRSMDRDEERPRERDHERANDRRRDQDRNRDRDRDREWDRDRDRDRNRDRYGDRDRERDGGRPGAADRPRRDDRPARRDDTSPGPGRNPTPLSLGSLKGRFLKPSEDEDTSGGPPSAPAPASRSKAFLKPGSDDDEDSPPTLRQNPRVPNSKKTTTSSGPAQGSDEPAQEGEKVTEAVAPPPPPPQEGRHGSKAAVTSSSEEEEEVEELPLLTDEEMNKLGAKLVKAEIMGNTAVVEKLKSQMESARKAKDNHEARLQQAHAARASQPPGRSEEDQELLLFRTDHSGRAWPVNAPSEPQEPRGGRRKRKPIETHVEGERVRYFQDDDGMGLQEMVRREKMSTPQDQNALYSRMAAKMMGKADGDNYTLDDMFVSSAAQREGEGRDEERMRSQAVAEGRRLAASLDQCPRCFNSQQLQKHLIVAIGAKVPPPPPPLLLMLLPLLMLLLLEAIEI